MSASVERAAGGVQFRPASAGGERRPPGQGRLHRRRAAAHLRRARRARPPLRRGAAGRRRQARGAGAAPDARFVRLAGRLSRRRSSPAPCRSPSTRCSPPTTTPTCSSTRAPRRRSSAARVKPALKAALTKSDHEVHKVVVSRPTQPLEFGEVEFEAFLDAPRAARAARRDPRRRSRLLALFVRLDRPAQGDRPFARQPVLDGRALRQGDPRPARGRRLLLGGQAVLRLRARQRADLPAVRSARPCC